ncbi:unnamed protein product [Euphydryas editha]|uniref:Endonuclease/exonuclease/phosphatase domain-containing protein n=1 Tax=Euphydryas editha TaxID=104508 RepID=A0AAU9U7Y8_EUPED|nr:unnamed protein product [Euphydryas editha]
MDIYYQNVRGLRTKTNEVLLNITQTNYKIIVFTETWLNASVCSSEFMDDRYVVYRRDRYSSSSLKSDGGGVLIAVSRDIPSSRVRNWETDCEDLWVIINININNHIRKVALCAVYLPPPANSVSLANFLDNTSNIIDLVDDVILLGDFNLGCINWISQNDHNYMLPLCDSDILGCSLKDFICVNNLYQFNNIPNCDNKMLDLVLSTFKESKVIHPPELISRLDSKHPNLLLNIPLLNVNNLHSKHRDDYNFFKAEYTKINSDLCKIDWTERFKFCNDVDDMAKTLNDTLQDVIKAYVPKRKSSKSRHPPWFTKSLIRLKLEQDKLRQRYMRYNNPRDKLEYDILRSRCQKLNNKCYRDYKNRLESNIRENPKAFWRYIKDKRKGSSSIPATMFMNQSSANTGPDIAKLFANHFASMYTRDTGNIQLPDVSCSGQSLGSLSISKEEILANIKKLDIYKGAGPDGVPPIFIKRCGSALALPLYLIFNRSLQVGKFPSIWKKARVVPIHKKGDECNISNYRPISILSGVSKLFESLVCPLITRHIEANLIDAQHGFRKGRSTETNLLSFTSRLSREMDAGLQISGSRHCNLAQKTTTIVKLRYQKPQFTHTSHLKD